MQYSLNEIALSVSKMYSFTHMRSCTDYEDKQTIQKSEDKQAGFEDDIVSFVDVADLLKKLSWRKRFVFVKRCLGYENWQLAEMLKFSIPTIERDFRKAKIILKNMMAEG